MFSVFCRFGLVLFLPIAPSSVLWDLGTFNNKAQRAGKRGPIASCRPEFSRSNHNRTCPSIDSAHSKLMCTSVPSQGSDRLRFPGLTADLRSAFGLNVIPAQTSYLSLFPYKSLWTNRPVPESGHEDLGAETLPNRKHCSTSMPRPSLLRFQAVA